MHQFFWTEDYGRKDSKGSSLTLTTQKLSSGIKPTSHSAVSRSVGFVLPCSIIYYVKTAASCIDLRFWGVRTTSVPLGLKYWEVPAVEWYSWVSPPLSVLEGSTYPRQTQKQSLVDVSPRKTPVSQPAWKVGSAFADPPQLSDPSWRDKEFNWKVVTAHRGCGLSWRWQAIFISWISWYENTSAYKCTMVSSGLCFPILMTSKGHSSMREGATVY